MDKLKRHLKEVRRKYLRRKHKTNVLTKANGELPRLIVHKSNKYNYAEIVDIDGKTIAYKTDKSLDADKKTAKAFALGEEIAKLAQKKGVKKVVFDRNGYLYHGRVKNIAEWARKWGLEF